MPNTKGGKKYKKQKKQHEPVNRIPDLAEDGQYYAIVTKLLGNGRVRVIYHDIETDTSIDALANIRGAHRKKRQWVNINSFVLISKRDFDKSIVDIILVYKDFEVNCLMKYGEIHSSLKPSGNKFEDDDLEFIDMTENLKEKEKIKVNNKIKFFILRILQNLYQNHKISETIKLLPPIKIKSLSNELDKAEL